VFFARCERGAVGKASKVASLTVAEAFEACWVHRGLHKPKSISAVQAVVKAHILPIFGATEVRKLTRDQIEDWLNARAPAPKCKRPTKGDTQTFEPAPLTEDQKRARKVSANRLLAVFKVALNLAVKSQRYPSLTNEAWRLVKPFGKVADARRRFLDDSLGEQIRLINSCPYDFRDLLERAMVSYGRSRLKIPTRLCPAER
jgi:hypothetical protein